MTKPKVWCHLEPDVYAYFFRKVYAGERGIKQWLVSQFFEALYQECLRQGIKGEWNEASGDLIKDIMANLNFNEQRKRSSGAGCTLDSSLKRPAQSSPNNFER